MTNNQSIKTLDQTIIATRRYWEKAPKDNKKGCTFCKKEYKYIE